MFAWWSRSEGFRSHANVLLVIFSACVDPSGARSRIISTRLASMCRHGEGGKDMLSRWRRRRAAWLKHVKFRLKNDLNCLIFDYNIRTQLCKNLPFSCTNATKWPILVVFLLMRLQGMMSTRSSSQTEINWTRLWVVITHVTLDFGARIHTLSTRLHLIMEKVVKASLLLLGICVWYPPGKQQAVGNLRPPLPLRRKPVWRHRPRKLSAKHRRPFRLLAETLPRDQHKAAELWRFPFHNCPHSVHHRPGGAVNWTRK